MASRPDDDDSDYEVDRPDTDPARDNIEDLEDGEQDAVETSITRLPPG